MDKITLSLHDTSLKEKIKKYAKDRGVTVSAIVESYLKNLVKAKTQADSAPYEIPNDLDILLDGIDVEYELRKKDYKELRDDMYEKRQKSI